MSDINDFGRNSLVRHTTGLKEKMEKCTMTEQQEKILAVLDMSEDEQDRWCALNTDRKSHEHLADLAFRLRDEVCGEVVHMFDRYNFEMALRQVYTRVGIISEGSEFLIWIICEAKPIHWILAALMAKTKESK